jgi:hypothetical protein
MDDVSEPGRLLSATAVHDGAMLSRITARLAVHPIASFSYLLTTAGRAEVRIEVRGGDWHEERVLQKLRRVIGVVEAEYVGSRVPGAG